MRLIQMGRRWGKTTALIRAAANDNGVIVCATAEEAERVVDQAHQMGHANVKAVGVRQMGRLRGQNRTTVYFDNADRVLQSIAFDAGCVAVGATWAGGEGE